MPVRTRTQAESLYGTPVPLSTALLPPVTATRSPTVLDIGYQLMQFWENTTTQAIFALVAYTNGQAIWQLVSSGGSPLNTLTGDIGGPIAPNAGNINIQGGGAGAIQFSNGGVGQMNAQVLVDNVTIGIVADQLVVLNPPPPSRMFTLHTVGAVTATTVDIPIPNNQATTVYVVFTVGNNDPGAPSAAESDIAQGVARVSGGVVTIVNGDFIDVSLLEDPLLPGLDYNLLPGGAASTIAISVTGIVGQDLVWHVVATLISTP